jgi:hypothetical protein
MWISLDNRGQLQISARSFPTMTVPRKCVRAASIHTGQDSGGGRHLHQDLSTTEC